MGLRFGKVSPPGCGWLAAYGSAVLSHALESELGGYGSPLLMQWCSFVLLLI